MDNLQPSSEASRLDRLEKKESILEAEISRLDQEEKDLERRLTELELKEIELAKSVSRLTQIKTRRPEFLINYMKTAKKRTTASEDAPAPMPSPQPAAAQMRAPAPETKSTPAEPQPAPPAQPKPIAKPTPTAPQQPAAPAQPKPETKPAAPTAPPQPSAAENPPAAAPMQPSAPEIKPAPAPPQPTAASAQTLLPHVEETKPKVEEKSERKQILEAQIKNVLKKQEMKKIEEQQKQEVLDSKAPIHKMNLNDKMSESGDLFKLLLSKGTMTLEEAGKIMKVDKDTMAKAAKDLEDSGLIEVNRPLYGSPKIRLKSLTEGMKDLTDKPQEKK